MRDPDVTADHYGARNLRLWQVILVWILAIDLLVMMLWRFVREREDSPRTSRHSVGYVFSVAVLCPISLTPRFSAVYDEARYHNRFSGFLLP